MASKTTLNARNLEALGAAHLASLLMDLCTGNAAMKSRLRMELAGAGDPQDLIREIRKRLDTIARSRSFIDWRGVHVIACDLETQHQAIVGKVAKAAPREALDLLFRFMTLAVPIFERSDDGNGTLIKVFHGACRDIGDVAVQAKVDPILFADRVYGALIENDYGQFDGLIEIASPALGEVGLNHLKKRVTDLSSQPVKRPAKKDRVEIGWSLSGPVYKDEIDEMSRRSTVSMALKDIADAQGDVDAFINQYDKTTRKVPLIAAMIAQRLLAAGRAREALTILDAAERQGVEGGGFPDFKWRGFEWEDARIDVLEALGRPDDAQKVRWDCFNDFLSSSHLRAYLKKLPDFEDIDAEDRALAQVENDPNFLVALSFLVSWPALDRAARLVIRHTDEIDGNFYAVLTPAANALAARYPLAATLLLRAMIDFSLTKSRSSRYKHVARHFLECSSLSKGIEDFGAFETHDVFEARLRLGHGRKTSFWDLIYPADR